MSFISTLTKIVNSVTADGDINYEPYSLKDQNFFYGLPPVPIRGIDYISAQYSAPRSTLVKCLTANGVHLSNLNTSGIIEIGLMSGSVSGAAIQLMNFTGLPFPIFIEDGKSGGTSTVVGTACKLVQTPEWRREAKPGLDIYTFSADKMTIIHGVRLITDNT